jgi:hypothetical protein
LRGYSFGNRYLCGNSNNMLRNEYYNRRFHIVPLR